MSMVEALEWMNSMKCLRQICKDDEKFMNTDRNLNLDSNSERVRDNVAKLYVRYMVTSNQLNECYKYIIQPQIRILIKKTVMCMYGRIFELKQILVNEDSSIYTPIITELVFMKILYEKFELKIPEYFREERQLFLNDMDSEIDNIKILYSVKNNNDLNQLQEEISITEEQSVFDSQFISQEVTESNSVNVNEGDIMTYKIPDFNMTELLDEIQEKQNKADMMLRTALNNYEERFNQIYKFIIMDKIQDLLQAYIWIYYKKTKNLPSWPEDPTPMFTNNDTSTLSKDHVLNTIIPSAKI
uniref:Uncharacterized protein n=1 Tax=Sipha flava TaxID=143950 RepID=A0A2S2Q841_9HEMI